MGLDKDTPIKNKLTFADIVESAYNNTVQKRKQIENLIGELTKIISEKKSPTALGIYIPLMKEYLDASISNNDQLVRLAAVIQKLITAGNSDKKEEIDFFSKAERQSLLSELNDIAANAGGRHRPIKHLTSASNDSK